MTVKKIVVLFSGGIDSFVLAEKLRRDNYEVIPFTMKCSVGSQETAAARQLAHIMGLELIVVDASAIAEMFVDIPVLQLTPGACQRGCEGKHRITAHLSVELLHLLASMYALTHEIKQIAWAVHCDDFQGMESRVKNYLRHFETMLGLRVNTPKLDIITPFENMTKAEVVALGRKFGLPLEVSWSCGDKDNITPCGVCDQCIARQKVMLDQPICV